MKVQASESLIRHPLLGAFVTTGRNNEQYRSRAADHQGDTRYSRCYSWGSTLVAASATHHWQYVACKALQSNVASNWPMSSFCLLHMLCQERGTPLLVLILYPYSQPFLDIPKTGICGVYWLQWYGDVQMARVSR